MSMCGIDISSWQGDIDLSKLDIDFVICKATESVSYVNPLCDGKIQQAKSLGMKYGFYHFAGGYDPIAEANFFIDNCKGYFNEGIPVLDFEADAITRWGSDGARSFLQRVLEVTGVRPIIYMSQSITQELNWSKVAPEFGLWVAAYPNISHPGLNFDADFGKSIAPWDFMAIWQYCSDGRIDGYGGDLDLNIAFMDEAGWNSYAGVNNKRSDADISSGGSDSVRQVDVIETEKHRITIEEK